MRCGALRKQHPEWSLQQVREATGLTIAQVRNLSRLYQKRRRKARAAVTTNHLRKKKNTRCLQVMEEMFKEPHVFKKPSSCEFRAEIKRRTAWQLR